MAFSKLFRRSGLAVMLAGLLFAMTGARTIPVYGANLAQAGTTPVPILDASAIIEGWTVGGGFLYWYESCNPFLDETRAFLKRRAVNGTIVQTLVNIPDNADACETLIGPAVDDSGFYYYNRSAGTIEAIYSNTPTNPPSVLATIGERTDIGFGDGISRMFLDEEFVYWIEVDPQGEFVPDVIRIRRVSKSGSAPVTLLTYDGYFAGDGMAISGEFIWWTDSEGLQQLTRNCPQNAVCTKNRVHEKFMRSGIIYLNEADDLVWWDADPTADVDPQILLTRCQAGVNCQTQPRYTAPDLTSIYRAVANTNHIYWLESTINVGPRMRRLPLTGGSPQTIYEEAMNTQQLAIDDQGLYLQSWDRERILRLPLDAQAILREISFGGWEVTQAIQSVDNDVPLLAGKATFVRVYPALDSGSSSAGVQALLYGLRDGTPLPNSPLYALNGTMAITTSNALDGRADVDGGWLFELPLSWTKDTADAIPLQDADLTLRAVLDPLNLTGDTTPNNNSAEQTFTFIAKAPTCVNLRPVWTVERYQSPWDQSVAGVLEVAESAHPTPRILAFPEYNRLEEIDWCWKWYGYGPYCSTPYELDDDDSGLLTKMGVLDYFHDSPGICFATGARTLYAGIVSTESTWSWGGLARRGKDQSLSKVPRYGTWSWPMTRRTGNGMTFVHEVGHNYDRKHVDCNNPKNPDTNYPYATDRLDDGVLDAAATHFGFDTRLLTPLAPDTSADYMSYCGPRWPSDYTWKAIFNNTRHAGPLFPFAGAAAAQADAYVLVSGLITATIPSGELTPAWRYPTAQASESLVQKWAAAVAPPWTNQPYHVRILGSGGAVLDDRAVILVEVEDRDGPAVYPFNIIYPAPDASVRTIQLMAGETVLDSIHVGTAAPQVTILAPQGGETVGNEFTLQWTATDADDEPYLVYTVQYSPDLGETWFSLVAELAGPGNGIAESLPVDLSGQPGSAGQTALLRVIASDGYHTGLATSKPFSVAPRAPTVLITAPEAGQWFAAGDPVPLRGDAFDPEDGVINDAGFQWSLTGLEINARRGFVMGLAPGAHTATLQATDSDGQQGSAQVPFHVAPLDVPLATEPALDGKCDDVAYGALSLPLAPYAGGEVASAALVRTAEHLWLCLQGLQGAGDYAGIQVDVDNSQETTVQTGDRGFFVKMDGTLVALAGGGFAPVSPNGMAAHVSGDGSTWSAELRVEAGLLGGWNRRVALGVGHYLGAASVVWPHTTALLNPQTWAQTNLGTGEALKLTALSPTSAVIGGSVTLSVSGSGFQPETVIVWDGAALATTFVDGNTLQATVDAELLHTAGNYLVQVAPGVTPLLASPPLVFIAYNPQTAITGLNPNAIDMGNAAFTLAVNGASFVDGATVLWNGEARPTTFVSSSQLRAQIDAADVAAALTIPVTVANPDPNAGIAAAAGFTILPGAQADLRLYLPMIRDE